MHMKQMSFLVVRALPLAGGLMAKRMFAMALAISMATTASSMLFAADPVTRHVNLTTGDDTAAAADATGLTPFASIQSAIDKSSDGDTILVDPGVYKTGSTTDKDGGESRIYVTHKLTIRSTGSRNDTVIEGQWDTETDPVHGIGPNAVRCVCIAADGKGSVLQGFTFLNGATKAGGDSAPCRGGGFYDYSSGQNSFVVDCAFVNCSAERGGGMRYGVAARTLFKNCYGTNYGTAREANLYFCVFEDCTGTHAVAYAKKVINCTFIGNNHSTKLIHFQTGGTIWNCVVCSGTCSSGGTQNADVVWDGCVSHTTFGGSPTVNDNCQAKVEGAGTFAPFFGDAHPYRDGPLDGTANVAAKTSVPEDFRSLDFEGKPVSWEDGELAPGAYQDVKVPVSGKQRFKAATSVRMTVDGVEVASAGTDYFHDAVWPTQHLVKVEYTGTENREVARLDLYLNGSTSVEQGARPVLTLDNEALLTAPPAGTTAQWEPYLAPVYWVDKEAAEYEGEPDGTPEKPFRDIQSAVDFKANVRTIKVKAGVYDSNVGRDHVGGLRNRVEYINGGYLRLMGVDGAERTFIVGAAASDADESGCGSDAVRCLAVSNNCLISGFTLTGGRTDVTGEETGTGGAVYRVGGQTFVADCIISNNAAPVTSVCNGGRLVRCRITGNRTLSGGFGLSSTGYAVSCVFAENAHVNGDIGSSAIAYNCTFVESAKSGERAFANDSQVFHSVCYCASAPGVAKRGYGSVIDGSTGSQPAEFLVADPCFRDRDGGDYHLANVSAAVGIRDAGITDWWKFVTSDIEGNRQLFVNGKVTAGAFQRVLPSVRVSAASGSEDDVSPKGVVFDDGTGSVTLHANANRLINGFSVNGELQPDSRDPAGWTYRFPSAAVVGDAVKAEYLTDWYVDPSKSDDNTGESPEKAKKTLEKVLAHVIAGDTVHLAEGEYNEGSMLQAEGLASCTPTLRSRAVVPSHVTLVADGARDRTIIFGASATGEGADADGCGPNAMRCVLLQPKARLSGVTLRGGRTGTANREDDNNHGAGVLTTESDSGIVEDCVIEDCCSQRGGGSRNGTFFRCRFLDNKATRNCAAGRQGRYYGCFFDNNHGNEVVGYYLHVEGCTFGPHNTKADGTGTALAMSPVNGTYPHVAYGTLFCGSITSSSASAAPIALSNCAIYAGVSLPAGSTVADDCVTAPKEDLAQLDADGVPIPGLNPACDRGNLALWQAAMRNSTSASSGDTDAAGNPRVANAAMDIGCYEADWKARYSTDIGKRRCLDVTAAPAFAHEDTNGEVFLPDGAISGTLHATADFDYRFPVRLTGNGTLTVTIDGVSADYVGPRDPFTVGGSWTADGDRSVTFDYQPGENDAGGAYFGRGGRMGGVVLVVR